MSSLWCVEVLCEAEARGAVGDGRLLIIRPGHQLASDFPCKSTAIAVPAINLLPTFSLWLHYHCLHLCIHCCQCHPYCSTAWMGQCFER